MKSFFEDSLIEPNSGGFIIYKTDNTFVYIHELDKHMNVIDASTLEELLFEYCKSTIDDFSVKIDNNDVYAFTLYVYPFYGEILIYINTKKGLLEKINRKPMDDHNKLWLKYHGIGEFKYIINDELPQPLNNIMELYVRIYEGQGRPKFLTDVAIKNDIFEEKLITIAENVINKLKPFEKLNKSPDFIAYVADHNECHFSNTVDIDTYLKFVKLK